MANLSQRIKPQYERQKHQFLDYREVVIHFIYSFSWDITKWSWDNMQQDLLSKSEGKIGKKATSNKGWKRRLLHERVLDGTQRQIGSSYQPNLVTKSTVLEINKSIANNAALLIPVEEYSGLKLKKCRELPVDLWYTIRLFDTGGATCTFGARLREHIGNFENIHMALHLAHNVDFGEEPNLCRHHLTNSFIKLPVMGEAGANGSVFPQNKDESVSFEEGYCSLQDLFRRLLRHPPEWASERAEALLNDGEVINMDDPRQDFQSPFVFTVAQLKKKSFSQFLEAPTLDTAKEVASILCKLTLDNRYIRHDFLNISEDYITNVLAYNKERHGLINFCLDRRLFFGISRRGAIALTINLQDVPSCFVVPSLLNLCEILRARWHMSNVLSARLDQAITHIGSNSDLNPLSLMEKMVKWRIMFAAFLRDPVPFLFDGGSVTEIAEVAEKDLWLSRLRGEIYQKFETLDRLTQDYLERKRIEELIRLRSGETTANVS